MPNPDDLIEPSSQGNLRERINAGEAQRQASAGQVRERIADVAARQAPEPGNLRQQITNAAPMQQEQARAVQERMAQAPNLRQQLTNAAPQQAADARAVAQRLNPPTLTDVVKPGNINPSLRDDLIKNSVQAQNDAKAVQSRLQAGAAQPAPEPNLRQQILDAAPRQQMEAQQVAQRLNAGAPPATPQPDLRAQINAAAPQAQADAQAVQQRLQAGAPPAEPGMRERLLARAQAAPSAADQALRARLNPPGSIAQAASQAVAPAAPAADLGRMGAGVAGAAGRNPAAAPAARPAAPAASPAAPAAGPAAPPTAGVTDASGRPIPTRVPGATGGMTPSPSAGTVRPDVGAMRATMGLPPTPPGAAPAAGAAAGAAGIAAAGRAAGAAPAAAAAAPAAAPAAGAAADAAARARTAAGVAGAAGRAAGAGAPAAAAPAAAAAAPAAEAGAGANATRLARTSYNVGKFVGNNRAILGKAGVAGAGAQVISHFNDYKLNEPDVDSSAGGTLKALFTGDFSGAGKSALKGLKEAAMDVGSAAANAADYVIPGNAPVSRAYDQMLHEKLGDKLVPDKSVIADMARGQPAPAAKPVPAAAPEAAKPVEKPAAPEAAKPAAKEGAKPAAAQAPQPNLSNMAANARDEALGAIDNEEAADPRAVYYETVNHKDGTTTYETRDRGQIVVKEGAQLSPEDQQRIETYKGRQSQRDGIEQRYQQMLQHLQGGGDGMVPASPVANAARSAGQAPSNPKFEQALGAEGADGDFAVFARSLIGQESSNGKNTKTSNRGAVGPMQVRPGTFGDMADKGWDINNEDHNMRAGIRYARMMWEKAGGDPALAAAGYYGGPGGLEKARAGHAVRDPKNPNAPDTLQYGKQVAARMGQGAQAAPAQAAAAPAYGARDFRNPLDGAVEVINMGGNAERSMYLPGKGGDVRSGLTPEAYSTLQTAIRNNPALAERMVVNNSGVAVDGMAMPLNVIAGGDGLMAQYARSTAQGQRIAANPTAGKLAEHALQGEYTNRGHQIQGESNERVAKTQAEAQMEAHRIHTAGGGVNQETGQPMPTNIFDQKKMDWITPPRSVPPKAVAIQQARESLKRGSKLEDVNAILHGYGYEPITQ